MPYRGTPRAAAALALLVLGATLLGACRREPTPTEEPDAAPAELVDELVDAPALCAAGCERLERCVPELASEIDGDPAVIADRLASECAGACESFEDQGSSLALRDCLDLGSCNAYWGCVGATSVRPWLATVAPVGERTCENLCGQASVCAIAKVCEADERRRVTKAGEEGEGGEALDPECLRDEVRRGELDETCRLRCEATAEDSVARTELIGCIDHASCAGMLACLDSWVETDYGADSGPTPGISETCDAFCSRAIVCGAEEEQVELDPEELDELKQVMTSTYVECAVQCGKDLEGGSEAVQAAFDACTASKTCEEFTACALEV